MKKVKVTHVVESNWGGVISRYQLLEDKSGIFDSKYIMCYYGSIQYQEFGEVKFDGDTNKRLKESDIVVFHSGCKTHGFYLEEFERRLNSNPKSIVCVYHGVELRYLYTKEIIEFHKKNPEVQSCVTTPDLLSFLPTATWIPHPIFHSLNSYSPFPFHQKNGKIRIVHSTSSQAWDTSEYFEEVFTKLDKRFPNRLEKFFITKKKFNECLGMKRHCHLSFGRLADEFGNGWINNSNLESMSQGVPSFSELDETTVKTIGVDCPVVKVNKHTLYDVMSEFVFDILYSKEKGEKSITEEIGEKSRGWVIKNHDPGVTLDVLKSVYGKCGF